MSEHNLFQEVQEDLERQKLEALWKKYGPWIVVAALGIVVSTASSTAYRSWKADRDRRVTSALLAATRASPEASKSIESIQKFVDENASSNEAALAVLRAGALALDQDDKPKAIQFFDKVAADAKADPAFRQLGDLLSVQAQMDGGDAAQLSLRLQPLTAEGAAWRYSALEAQALLALRAGEKNKAEFIFSDLSRDSNAPRSLAARAADLLRTLNVD